jgi:hypothetical protein
VSEIDILLSRVAGYIGEVEFHLAAQAHARTEDRLGILERAGDAWDSARESLDRLIEIHEGRRGDIDRLTEAARPGLKEAA